MCVRDKKLIGVTPCLFIGGIASVVASIFFVRLLCFLHVLEELAVHVGEVQQLAGRLLQPLLGSIIRVIFGVGTDGTKAVEVDALVPAQDDLEGLEDADPAGGVAPLAESSFRGAQPLAEV